MVPPTTSRNSQRICIQDLVHITEYSEYGSVRKKFDIPISCCLQPRATFIISDVFFTFSYVAEQELDILEARIVICIGKVQCTVSWWSVDYIPGYGGDDATFLENGSERRRLDVVTMFFLKEAGSKRLL